MTRTAPAIRSKQKSNFLRDILLPQKTLARRRVQMGSVKIMVRASPRGMYYKSTIRLTKQWGRQSLSDNIEHLELDKFPKHNLQVKRGA